MQVATGSKDATIGLSQLQESGLSVVRSYDQIFDGVVKSVRWAPAHLGNSGYTLNLLFS